MYIVTISTKHYRLETIVKVSMQSNPTEINKPQTSVFRGTDEKHQLRLYLLRTERAQVALQVPAGHQLHNDECGLAL